jgi:hypothetical protein
MTIKLDRRTFVDNLLGPASKISDNICLDVQEDGTIKTLVTSVDNATILLASLPSKCEQPFKCIIPDCKTFLRLFAGIEQDEISLVVGTNAIEYISPTISFKYHLLDESYMVAKKSISEEKLNAIEFDTAFEISKSKFSEILKFNSIIPDAEKLYFVTKEGKVFAKIGDEQRANTNEIVCEAALQFQGSPIIENVPLNIQNILLMSFAHETIKVSINHKLKIFKFVTPYLKYIASGLVK